MPLFLVAVPARLPTFSVQPYFQVEAERIGGCRVSRGWCNWSISITRLRTRYMIPSKARIVRKSRPSGKQGSKRSLVFSVALFAAVMELPGGVSD